MSTNTTPSGIPLTILPSSLPASKVLSFPPFTSWLNKLESSLATQRSNPDHPFHSDPYSLQNITIQSVDFFGSGDKKVGFLKLQAEIKNNGGESLPGAVFLRGGSVGMLVVLYPEEDGESRGAGEKWVILTVQPRVPAGVLDCVELPAGMVDNGTVKGAAAKEIEEECGIVVKEEDLVELTPMQREDGGEEENGVWMSPGGCDEVIRFFLVKKTVSRGKLEEMKGRLTGLREEGEKITLRLVRWEEVWRSTRDAKVLCAWAVARGMEGEGRLEI